MIIGLAGFKSSGKDTIADLLVLQYGFKKLSFASVLKDMLSIIFSWPRDKLEGLDEESREWREQPDEWWSKTLGIGLFTPRDALQIVGTDLFRDHLHEDIWVKVLERKLLQNINYVISDCRFENEINMLIQHGGKIVHVYRNLPKWFDDYKNNTRIVYEASDLHCSEKEWIRCHSDIEIINDGSLEELHEKTRQMFLNFY